MRTLRIMSAEDVETAADLMMFFRLMRKALKRQAYELLNVGWTVNAMLRRVDKIEGRTRRHKVSRRAKAASLATLATAGLVSKTAVSFRTEYPELFDPTARKPRAGTARREYRRRRTSRAA